MCVAAPAELLDEEPDEVPVAVPDPEADPEAPEADVEVEATMTEVIDPDMETVTVPLPYGTVFRPVLRPAGKVATIGWVVTTAG